MRMVFLKLYQGELKAHSKQIQSQLHLSTLTGSRNSDYGKQFQLEYQLDTMPKKALGVSCWRISKTGR